MTRSSPTGTSLGRTPEAPSDSRLQPAVPPSNAREADWEDSRDPYDLADVPVKVLSRDEAQALLARYRRLTPRGVLAAQVAAGLLAALICGVFVSRPSAPWSALYGAAVVVLPGALMARSLASGRNLPVAASQIRLLVWTVVKLAMACAMLAGAQNVVRDLHWPSMLAALIVCLQVNVLALLWQGRMKKI